MAPRKKPAAAAPDAASTPAAAQVETRMLPVTQIEADPSNIRRAAVDAAAEAAFHASIRQQGILSPLLVRPLGADRYRVVFGGRRLDAARAIGLPEVPCMVREMTDGQALGAQTAENSARADMAPVDTWRAIIRLQQDAGLPLIEAGRCMGLSDRRTRQLDKLGRLAPKMIAAIEASHVPDDHDLATLAMAPHDMQERALKAPGAGKGKDILWRAVVNACRVTRLPKSLARFDESAGVVFTEDLFAPPGSDEQFTTSDVEGFLAAQERWLKAEVTGRKVCGERIEIAEFASYHVKLPPGWGYVHNKYEPITGKSKAMNFVALAKEGSWLGNIQYVRAEPIEAAKPKGKGGSAAPASEPVARPAITQAGLSMIAAHKTEALRNVMVSAHTDASPGEMLGFLLLALTGMNVQIYDCRKRYGSVRTRWIQNALIDHTGVPRPDMAVEAPKVAARLLRDMLGYGGPGNAQDSGDAADWIGGALAAYAELPRFDTAEFLATCSGEMLREVYKAHLPEGVKATDKVGELRRGLVGKLPGWRPSDADFQALPPPPSDDDEEGDEESDEGGEEGDEGGEEGHAPL